MKVELPYLVQDQLTAYRKGLIPIERFTFESPDELLDGPVSRQVAVVDFDEATGEVLPGAVFDPPVDGRIGRYRVREHLTDRGFQAVSLFATVLKTMRAFEEEDVLGRPLTWAFGGPQLLVVPRAGDWANAFYERESRSLQFFSFTRDQRTIHTSLSLDIIAHETGHAILDGIAPELYDAITPQSLALHEAIADLTTLTVALDSGSLRTTVLEQTGGRIDGWTALSAVAEEFGMALGQGKLYLRSLWNEKTLDPNDRTRDEEGNPNFVDPHEPHDCCQVLTGALFRVLTGAHEYLREKYRPAAASDLAASEKALAVGARILRRFAFRALDYLPPGEVSFADYGRAIVAADTASNDDKDRYRKILFDELLRRHVVKRPSDLTMRVPRLALDPGTLSVLAASDWAAYDFANRQRALLRIPEGVPFRVLPRRETDKITYREGRPVPLRELIFKVAWEEEEENDVGKRLPRTRVITVGTTLVFNRDDGRLHTRLTTDSTREQRRARSELLRRALDDELLHDGGPELGTGLFRADVAGGRLRLRGGGRALHLALGEPGESHG